MTVLGAVGESGLGQILAKRLTTPGAAVAPGVAPELFPNLVLENDRPEWGFLKQELRFGRYISVAAGGAGQYARVYLYNPDASGLIVTLEQFAAGNTGFLVAPFQPDGVVVPVLGTEGRGFPRDTRLRRGAQSAAIIYSGTDADANPSAGAGSVHYQLTTEFWDVPIVLGPGGQVQFIFQTADSGVNMSLQWRERRAQPGELV